VQPTPALFGCADKRPPDQRTQNSEAPCGGVLPSVANVHTQSTSLPHAGCASLTSMLQPASPQDVSVKSIKLPGLAACNQFETLSYPLGLACPFLHPKTPKWIWFWLNAITGVQRVSFDASGNMQPWLANRPAAHLLHLAGLLQSFP